MALSQSDWTEDSVNGLLVLECYVTVASAVVGSYTKKTPARTLDPTKPWTLHVNTLAETVDDETLPVDIWAGFDDDFELTGFSSSVVATSGGEVASAVMDDVQAAMLTTIVDPNYTGTVVQAASGVVGIVNAGTAPYYAISLDCTTAMLNVTCHFKIVQQQ